MNKYKVTRIIPPKGPDYFVASGLDSLLTEEQNTMTQHTPGPWYNDGLSILADYKDADGNRHHCHVADTTNRNEFNRTASMEELANARVLGNSLNMLATLQWIAYEAGQYADGAEDAHYLAKFLTEVEQRARAAITKATGG